MRRLATALLAVVLLSSLGCTAVVGHSRQRDREIEEIQETLREIRTDLEWMRTIVIENRCQEEFP